MGVFLSERATAGEPDAGIIPSMPGSRTFTYEEALASFPDVERWTHEAVAQIESLVNAVRSREEGEERREELQLAIESVVEDWTDRITTLGCEVKGLWLVDWDSGAGYYCWKYPERTLGHFHGYEDGFAGRVPIH